MPPKLTNEIITAAIDGYEFEKTRIDAKIAELRALLPGGPAKSATSVVPARKRKRFSAAARRKMALVQKARWAKIKGESEPPAAVTPPAPKAKRKLSKAGRAAIVAATKKRWDLVHKAQKAAVKKAPAKKKMSSARKAALVANLAKARAAKAKKAAGGKVPF